MKVLTDPRTSGRRRVNPIAEKRRIRMAEVNLAFFADEMLGIRLGDHHLEWADLLRRHYSMAVMAARGFGKSAFFSYAYPLWRSWRADNELGLLFTAESSQVAELMRIIKDGKRFVDDDGVLWELPAAAKLPDLAPIVPKTYRRTWTSEKLRFLNGSGFEGRTFGKEARSRHVQWIVCDDVQPKDVQWSDAVRQRTLDFHERDVEPMLLPGGQMVAVGTPLHSADLFTKLRKNEEYGYAEFPAIVRGDDGKPRSLWEEFRPMAWIRKKRRGMSSIAFSQEYLLRPATGAASLFPPKLLEQGHRPDLAMRPSLETINSLGWAVFFGVDLAISAEVGADYTVIAVLAVDERGNRYLIDLLRAHGMPFRSQLRLIHEAHVRYQPEMIFIESNQMQRVWSDELIRETDLPIRPYQTTASGKHSLEYGLPGLRTLFENGKFFIPRGDEYSQAKADVFEEELGNIIFEGGRVVSVGQHDDTVMGGWIGDQAVRAGGAFFLGDLEDEGVLSDDELDKLEAEEEQAGEEYEGDPHGFLESVEGEDEDGDEGDEIPSVEPDDAAMAFRAGTEAGFGDDADVDDGPDEGDDPEVGWMALAGDDEEPEPHPQAQPQPRAAPGDGVMAHLPSEQDREQLIDAWNDLSAGVESGRIAKAVDAYGRDEVKSALRTLLGLA